MHLSFYFLHSSGHMYSRTTEDSARVRMAARLILKEKKKNRKKYDRRCCWSGHLAAVTCRAYTKKKLN